MIDEATRTLSNRNFMQKRQKRFVVFSHAARVLGHIICYTAPVDALDSQLTPLLHMKASDGEVDRTRRVAHFQVKLNSFKMNIKTKQPIFDFLTVEHEGLEIELDSIAFPSPSVKLRNEYKKMKMSNVWALVDEGIDEQEKEDVKPTGEEDLEPYIARLLANPKPFLNSRQQFDPDEIQDGLHTTGRLARRIKKLADKRLTAASAN